MEFDEKAIDENLSRLSEKGVQFDRGLNEAEISQIELAFQFAYPPDLRCLLQRALPVGQYFVPWRADFKELDRWFRKPVEGVLFDVESNVFWYDEWGSRPTSVDEACQVAEIHLANVPRLIPIGDSLYLKCVPAVPCLAGNPIFSINQTDILHAGRDLADFLRWFSRPRADFDRDQEEGVDPTPLYSENYRKIPFWIELARQNSRR